MKYDWILRRTTALGLALLGLLAGPLAAQNILLAELDGKFIAVRKARDNRPFVEVDGKLVLADGGRFALRKIDEFRPEFIDVRNLQVKTRHVNVNGSELNHEFLFNAAVETPYYLDDVFLVLELDTDQAGKVLFLQEVGDLAPETQRTLAITVPLSSGLGEGKYKFHLFAGGLELLTTKMPAEFRDRAVDKMILKRITGVQEAMPKFFTGPPPEYPRALLKAKTVGQAVITLRVGANGRVNDPVVKSATDPAFGESALVAARLWRFLPRVKDGRPVETVLNVPFDFHPPKPAEKS
jgi:TonB family protein